MTLKQMREQEPNRAYVNQLTVAVYKDRLGERDTANMLADDNDGGKKLAIRAEAYEPIIRSTLRQIKLMEQANVKG